MPPFEFSFDTTPELANRAARLYIWRRAGWRILALPIAILCLLVVVIDGNSEWYIYVALGLGCAKILAWVAFYRRSASHVKAMENTKVDVHIDNEKIEMKDADGGCNINWTAQLKVWKSPHLWLLSYGNTRIYTYIPIDAWTDEAKGFVEEKILENGGVIF